MGWGLGARAGQAGASGSSLWVLCSDGVYASPLPAFSTWMQRGALWVSTLARSHLTVSLGGVRLPTPPPCGEAGLERAPSLTDHQDGWTRSPRWTLQDCPSWETRAAPPAGSLGRCGQATSICPAAFHEVPGSPLDPDHHVATEPGHGFVLPVEMFSDKAFVLFPDVGDVWSPVMISSSRKVHPRSPMWVSPLSNDERPQVCDLCLLGVQP